MRILFLDISETLYGVKGIFSDTMNFLEKVKDRYMIVIIADESAEEIKAKLDSFGIVKYFTVIVNSRDYEMKKPDYRLVNVALALTTDKTGETINKQDCFLVGDRPDIDIKMGNNAGIKTIRIKRGAYSEFEPEYDDEKATYTAGSLKDSLDILLVKAKTRKKMPKVKERKKK